MASNYTFVNFCILNKYSTILTIRSKISFWLKLISIMFYVFFVNKI